ncbi:MAG: SufD family Fe-S cluster assembly protein [Lachnospiraceae bacterium]|nr:SufD family Fe-S cluster assembly protein [Lachnospiraceae bacterium]
MQAAVNHLPVLTWNRLKLNRAQMEVGDDLLANTKKQPQSALFEIPLPEGISVEKNISADALQERFAALGIENPKEAFVAGKYPIYNRQRFGTGMGAAVDELMEGVGADYYTVDPTYQAEGPIKLHYGYGEGQSDLNRLVIHAKAGSRSTFILYYSTLPKACDYLEECGKCEMQQELLQHHKQEALVKSEEASKDNNTAGSLVGVQTYLYLEEGACVELHVVQMLEDGAVFFHDIGTFLRKKAELVMTKLDLGALTVYEGLNTLQIEDKSRFEMDFGYLGLGGGKMDINYNDVFCGKKCEGRMYFKEALLEDAQKTFRGTVDFRKDSTGCKGDEQEDVLLLGEDVINQTIPLILGEEEDVEGRHAATIGSLSEDMLFYMQTRGISKKKAEELMVRASLQSISNRVPSESIKKAVKNKICRVFE